MGAASKSASSSSGELNSANLYISSTGRILVLYSSFSREMTSGNDSTASSDMAFLFDMVAAIFPS